MNTINELAIEDAKIIFRNFSGAESKFNRAGDRNFCVVIDSEEKAKELSRDGWNVKPLSRRNEDEDQKYYISVAVSFKVIPPKIWLITKSNKTLITEDNVDTLDYADILTADVILRPYNWEARGESGVKAYLKSLYVVLDEDQFSSKYNV